MDGIEGKRGEPMDAGQECPEPQPLAGTEVGNEIIVHGQRLLVEPATEEEEAVIEQMRARSGWLAGGRKWVGVLLLSLAVGSGLGVGPQQQVARTGGQRGTVRRAVRAAPGTKRKAEDQESNVDGRAPTCESGEKGRPECEVRAGLCVHRRADGQCRSSNGPCRLWAGVVEVRQIVVEIHREITAVRKDFHEAKTAKERLEQMLAEKVFAFTEKIDAASFHILCAVLAHGDVAKASRALNVSDATLRSRIRQWANGGQAYQLSAELVRWRKAMGRKGTVLLNEAITKESAAPVDFAGLLADVLDEILEMNPENWAEKAEALRRLLQPHVTG